MKIYLKHQIHLYDSCFSNVRIYFYSPDESDDCLAIPALRIKALARLHAILPRLPVLQNILKSIDEFKMLKEIGCDRVSFGVEHGNPEFRRTTSDKCGYKYCDPALISSLGIKSDTLPWIKSDEMFAWSQEIQKHSETLMAILKEYND